MGSGVFWRLMWFNLFAHMRQYRVNVSKSMCVLGWWWWWMGDIKTTTLHNRTPTCILLYVIYINVLIYDIHTYRLHNTYHVLLYKGNMLHTHTFVVGSYKLTETPLVTAHPILHLVQACPMVRWHSPTILENP